MYSRYHYSLSLIADYHNISISRLTSTWVHIYEQRLSTRGKADAVKFVKELNTVCERYALRQNIKPMPWTKSDNENFPICLGAPFKEFLRHKDPSMVVMALSVMRTCELLRLPISKDIDSVTAPCNADQDLIQDIIKFIPKWVCRLQRLSLRGLKYHYTVKNGPNGHALHTSDSDIFAVINDIELFESIQMVQWHLNDTRPMETSVPAREGAIHSKLTQFPEKAGKTRTIAIVDYYSQRALKPLHKGIMDILRSLVSDGTYSHQNVGKFAQQKTKEKSFIYCADLTAFTDRFPASIQRELLEELIQEPDLSRAFWSLLAERTFTVAWSGEQVSYACGQPMGCYASWPLCSLAHHLLIEYAAYKAGIKSCKYKYKLIGDDVIITDPEIAQNYQKFITALGVEVNLSKTVQSQFGSNYSGAEVAKQLYLNGICLTPLTPGFVLNLRKPHMFNTCVGILNERYEWFKTETPPMLIDRLFRQKDRRLVWLLSSNPINGRIKPGMPGYDVHSPWVTTDVAQKKDRYFTMLVDRMIAAANLYIDQGIDRMFGLGDPWKDLTQPPPRALRHVNADISYELQQVLYSLNGITTDAEAESIVAEFDFIPNPSSPYEERKETRQRRISSTIEQLFDDNGERVFVELDW